jgi:hypothetical protein
LGVPAMRASRATGRLGKQRVDVARRDAGDEGQPTQVGRGLGGQVLGPRLLDELPVRGGELHALHLGDLLGERGRPHRGIGEMTVGGEADAVDHGGDHRGLLGRRGAARGRRRWRGRTQLPGRGPLGAERARATRPERGGEARLAIVLGRAPLGHRLGGAADVAEHVHQHGHALLHVFVARRPHHADQADGLDLVGLLQALRGLADDRQHLRLGERADRVEDRDDRVAEGLHVLGRVVIEDALGHGAELAAEAEPAALLEVVEAGGGRGHHLAQDGRHLGQQLLLAALPFDQPGDLRAQRVESRGEGFGVDVGVHGDLLAHGSDLLTPTCRPRSCGGRAAAPCRRGARSSRST